MESHPSEAFYSSLFDNLPDGLACCRMIFDAQDNPIDYVYEKVNKNFEKLTGLKNVIGKKVTEVIPGITASNPELFEIFGRVSLTGKSESFETFVEPLGRWFSVSVYSPKKKCFEAIFQNITKQKQIEKDFENAKIAARNVFEDLEAEKERAQKNIQELEKFKLAANGTSEHIIITDPNGIILFVNPAAERITGYSKSEIIGKKSGAKELWGGLMDKEFYQKMWHTIKIEKQSFSSEIKNRRKNGQEYYAHMTISPVLDPRGEVQFFVGIERDITKEKEIDKAKTEFVSLASHQLRTPLSAISWYSEMLLAGDAGKLSDAQKNYVEEVYRGNRRMVELVDALLNVSRIELGTFIVEPKPTDVVKLMHSAIDALKLQIQQKKLKLDERHSEKLPLLNADPKLLGMVFQNLLSNAIKYTSVNGKISIELRLAKRGELVGNQKPNEDSMAIVIADTGFGIPKDQQDKIFTKLFRADNVRTKNTEGTGLGLYIVKAIIDHSGGTIWFESEENKGTTFCVTLPLAGMKPKAGTKVLG